jgi:putative membrane protein
MSISLPAQQKYQAEIKIMLLLPEPSRIVPSLACFQQILEQLCLPYKEIKMTVVTNIVIAIVAILHLGFLVLEMFLWNHSVGRKTFKMTKEVSESSATLAANQGLYNGFLAAGLIWGLSSGEFSLKLFFLSCVLIAGIFGGFTAKRSILYIQALPAFIGLLLLYLSMR